MNNKISVAQLQALLIISALGFEILILPYLINSIAELALIVIAGFIISLIAIKSNIIINKSKMFSFIYSVKNIIVIVMLVKILSSAAGSVLLTDLSVKRIALFAVIAAGYSAYKGIEPVSRIAQMLFWFIVIGTIYVYAMTVPDINIDNIVMLSDSGNWPLCIFSAFIINTGEIILLLKPYVTNINKNAVKATIFSFVLVFLISFIIMGKIGLQGMKNIKYPFFEIMYTANSPNIFIKRQEGIFISLWIISALITIFIYYGVTVNYMESLKIDKRFSIWFIMLFVFFINIFSENTNAIKTYCFIQIICGFFTVFIIPLIYVFRKKV